MASSSQIGAIHVEASIDTVRYIDGARKLTAETKKTEAAVKSSFSSMGAAVKGFGGAMAAGLSVGLLAGVAKKALDFAAAIGTTAKQLGVTTKELQEFRYAADQVGIKNAEADKGLERLGATLGKAAAGSKTATAALGSVGITLADIQSKTKVEIFGKIADQMIKQGGAAKNAAAANAIFGESASKLSPLLDQGSRGINELSLAAERLGIVLSDEQIQKADQTAQKLDDVKTVLAAQIAGVVADNADSIVSLANALGQLTSAVIGFLGSNPQLALAILGAMAGSRFGLPGAAIGAVVGARVGVGVAQGAADGNMDPRFRAQQIRKAQADLARAKAAGSNTTRAMPGVGTPISMSVADAQKELARQNALGQQALAAAKRGSAPMGNVPIPQFLAGGGGGRKRTPRARQGPRDRSDDVEFQFAQEARRAELDVLRAKRELAGTTAERAQLALDMLAIEKQMQDAEVKDRVRRAERDFAEGKITAAALEQVKVQADILNAKNDEAYKLQQKAILQDRELQQMERADDLAQRHYEHQLDDLRFAAEMAETTEDRRLVELQIVDTLYEQKEAHLRALKAQLELAGKIEEAADVQEEINRLPVERERDRARANRANRSPLADFKAQWSDIGEENEQALVNALDGMADALSRVTDGWKAMKEAALDTLKSLFQQLLSNQFKQLFAMAIPGAGGLGGIFGGGFNGGIGAGTGVGPITVTNANLPRFANGGSLRIWGNSGQDRNVISVNGFPVARADYGEKLTFENDNGPNRSWRGGGASINFNFPNSDFDSFRRNQRQAGRLGRRALGI